MRDVFLAVIIAFALGAIGGGIMTYRAFMPAAPLLPRVEGKLVEERDRSIAPRDTARQAEPLLEIRYRRDTVTVQDTVRVYLPSSLSTSFYAVAPQPLRITPSRAVLTRYDPLENRWEQQVYALPERRSSWALHGLYRWRPDLGHTGGIEFDLTYRRVSLRAAISTDFKHLYPEIGGRLRLTK